MTGPHDNDDGTPRGRGAGGPWVRAWLSDSSMMLIAQALTVLATSIAAISVARTLEPGDWGVFSAFLGMSLALAVVADFGLATWLLREFSRLAAGPAEDARSTVGRALSGALAINVGIALPLWTGAALWVALRRPDIEVAAALLALLAYGTLTASAGAMETYLRSRREVRLVVGVSILEKFLLLALLLAIAAFGGGLAGIGVAYVAAGLARIAADGLVVVGRRHVRLVRPRWPDVRMVARSSFPFALTTGSLNVIPRLDTLLLVTLSSTSAAWFAVGDRVIGPALLIPSTLGSTLYPFLAAPHARRTAPWKLSAGMAAGGLVVALVGIALAPFVVPALFGAAYDDAVPVTQIMLLTLPLVYATSPLLVSAFSSGAERRLVGPVLALSLLGSLAIAAGELLAGPEGAAVGFLARSALFLVFIGSIAMSASTRPVPAPDTRPLGAAPPLS
jgi:O-antigen/teichoic acid export membrane protein